MKEKTSQFLSGGIHCEAFDYHGKTSDGKRILEFCVNLMTAALSHAHFEEKSSTE